MIFIKRCAVYIRVSTAEQQMHGKSLQAQREYLLQYAADHQMTVTGVYADEGKTARKELRKRKAIHALLDSVKHKELDIILFWKMDRWFRNVSDFYKVQDILDQYGVKWIAVAEPNINMETRDGRLNLNIMLSIGQNEVDTTSERIRFVNESSIKQGRVIFGNASMPFGYKVDVVDGIKRMVKDKEKERITEDAFQYYLKHHTKTGTVKYINQKYGNVFSINIMNKLCKNTAYCGCYRGNANYCPAYITKSEYERIQQINRSNITVRSASGDENIYLFTGLLKCPVCGRTLTSNTRRKQTSHGMRYYRYYRCPNHYANHQCPFSKSCGEDTLEEYLIQYLFRSFQQYQITLLDIQHQSTLTKKVDNAKIEKEIERLNNMYQKGRISEIRYNEEYMLLKKQLASVDSTASDKPASLRKQLKKTLSGDWKSIYHLMDREHRRCFWRGMISSIEQNEAGHFRKIFFR